MNRYVIRIRGASVPPLLVIDNMPFPLSSDSRLNDLAQMIAPQDAERIEVIKTRPAQPFTARGRATASL